MHVTFGGLFELIKKDFPPQINSLCLPGLKDMNKHYRDCLVTSNKIISLHLHSIESSFTFSSLCADKLLYSHAIISVRSWASRLEVFDGPQFLCVWLKIIKINN